MTIQNPKLKTCQRTVYNQLNLQLGSQQLSVFMATGRQSKIVLMEEAPDKICFYRLNHISCSQQDKIHKLTSPLTLTKKKKSHQRVKIKIHQGVKIKQLTITHINLFFFIKLLL